MDSKSLNYIIKYHANSNYKYREYDLNKNNIRHGLYELWHPNGQLWIHINYQNGFLHGLYEIYNPDGSLDFRRYYNNGKIES